MGAAHFGRTVRLDFKNTDRLRPAVPFVARSWLLADLTRMGLPRDVCRVERSPTMTESLHGHPSFA